MKEMYKYSVEPINGRDMWPNSDSTVSLIPPKHHKQVGRPKKKRKRGPDEVGSQGSRGLQTLSRRFLSVTCGKCGKVGHNSRSCKGDGGPRSGGGQPSSAREGQGTVVSATEGQGTGVSAGVPPSGGAVGARTGRPAKRGGGARSDSNGPRTRSASQGNETGKGNGSKRGGRGGKSYSQGSGSGNGRGGKKSRGGTSLGAAGRGAVDGTIAGGSGGTTTDVSGAGVGGTTAGGSQSGGGVWAAF